MLGLKYPTRGGGWVPGGREVGLGVRFKMPNKGGRGWERCWVRC